MVFAREKVFLTRALAHAAKKWRAQHTRLLCVFRSAYRATAAATRSRFFVPPRKVSAARRTVASSSCGREAQPYRRTVSVAGLGAPTANATRSRFFAPPRKVSAARRTVASGSSCGREAQPYKRTVSVADRKCNAQQVLRAAPQRIGGSKNRRERAVAVEKRNRTNVR